MMMRTLVAVAGLAALASPVAAQVSPYYFSEETGINRMYTSQNNVVVNSWAVPPRRGPLTVDAATGRIHTTDQVFGGSTAIGESYNLAGVQQTPTGSVTLNMNAFPGAGRAIDAGYDGTNAYIVTQGDGRVYRYNGDLSGPGAFHFQANVGDQGITYDIGNNIIFTSSYFQGGISAGTVSAWNGTTGAFLYRFPVQNPLGVISGQNTALAYDPIDGSLWLNAHNVIDPATGTIGMMWQFSTTGAFLGQFHPNPTINTKYWGGEIIIPAPSAAAGLAGLALLGRRRRR